VATLEGWFESSLRHRLCPLRRPPFRPRQRQSNALVAVAAVNGQLELMLKPDDIKMCKRGHLHRIRENKQPANSSTSKNDVVMQQTDNSE
jgi:hypothetical protein